jgi:hypothetical protein
MKTFKMMALCALLLCFTTSFAINHHSKFPPKKPTSYIIHYIQHDLGPDPTYPSDEDYTLTCYVTNNVDTTYTSRIVVDETITTSWDAPGPWNITIYNGTSLGTFNFSAPPHNTFPPSFFAYVTLSTYTYNGDALTYDEDVTYY